MKLRKTNLDEQQERKLLEIESRGFWLAFWGILLALIVETVVMTKDLCAIIGELVLFMGLALYLAISCMRAGIWDRRADMSRRTCLLFSLAAGICAGLFVFAFTFARYQKPIGSLCAGAIGVVFTIALTYLILRLTARATKKRQDELNAEPDDDFDEEETHTS